MKFIKSAAEAAIQPICSTIVDKLYADKNVLWLLCGGSAIPTEVAIMTQIREHANDKLANLTILVGDDRYGAPGFIDSNYQQLRDAGFQSGAATWHDVLETDRPLDQTVQHYSQLLQDAQAMADYTIGMFGIGPDAHTAGVKPGSPAVSEDMATVVGYEWDDFTRMTMTPRELTKCDEAYVLAYGVAKKSVLERLRRGDESIAQTPCNLLHTIMSVYVYNDQISSDQSLISEE